MKNYIIIITREQSRSCTMLIWKNSSFTSADVDILGHGCGVSQYPQFY